MTDFLWGLKAGFFEKDGGLKAWLINWLLTIFLINFFPFHHMYAHCVFVFVLRRYSWIFIFTYFMNIFTHIFKFWLIASMAWSWVISKRNLPNGIILFCLLIIFWENRVFWAVGWIIIVIIICSYIWIIRLTLEDNHSSCGYILLIFLICLISCYGCGALPIESTP